MLAPVVSVGRGPTAIVRPCLLAGVGTQATAAFALKLQTVQSSCCFEKECALELGFLRDFLEKGYSAKSFTIAQ